MFGIGMGSMGRLKGSLSLAGKIKKLFSAGQAGAWYDFGQLSQEYQDSLGVNPVTAVEQPLGLVLDGKTGYARGVNLVIDGNFDVGIAGWIVGQDTTLTHDANRLKIAATAPSGTPNGAGSYPINCEIGKIYEVSSSISVGVGQIGFAVGTTLAGTQQYFSGYIESTRIERVVFTAAATTHYLVVLVNSIDGSQYGYLDNISIKRIQGNHLTQATAAARPVLRERVNQLIDTQAMMVGWSKVAGGTASAPVVTANAGVAPDGTLTANQIVFALNGGMTTSDISTLSMSSVSFAVGDTRVSSVYLKTTDGTTKLARLVTPDGLNVALITVTGDWQRFSASATATTDAVGNMRLRLRGTEGTSDSASLLIWAPQVEFGSTPTAYQRVNTATDYDIVGFPAYAKFDGVDDSMTSATGGGSTTGFFWCGAIKMLGGSGTSRDVVGDRLTNTGYLVRVDPDNRVVFRAGNGTALTYCPAEPPLALGVTYLLTVWDDGVNLNIQVNNGAVFSAARPVVVAGTSAFNLGYTTFNGNLYPSIYRTGTPITAAERAAAQAWCKSKAGL